MSVYQRGEKYWYKFKFQGLVFRESTKSANRSLAEKAERKRHAALEEGYNGFRRRKAPAIFGVAAGKWVETRTAIAPKTEVSYRLSIKHLSAVFGRQLITDIDDEDITTYQVKRRRDGVSSRTINIEVSALRSILRNYNLWEGISKRFSFLPEPETPGFALSDAEESTLLAAAGRSRSRGLPTVLVLAINTGLRACEIHNLRWSKVDLLGRTLVVGKSKTPTLRW